MSFFSNTTRHLSGYALLLLLCAAGAFLSGCEETVEDPDALPYEEKLVIRAILKAGKEMDNIRITRTLPPLDTYSDEKARVRNAVVLVRHNGITDTIPDTGSGLYYKPGIIPQPGEVYELSVEWNGKRATAVTRIPNYPQIMSVDRVRETDRWGDVVNVLVAYVDPYPGEVYSATYGFKMGSDIYEPVSSYVHSVYRASDSTASGRIPVKTEFYDYNGNPDYAIFVNAYDEPYYAYFTSYNNDDNDEFNPTSRNVKWNVHGDGIGMFIGITQSPARKVE